MASGTTSYALNRSRNPLSSPNCLTEAEVSAAIREVRAEWRNFFATALYTGMRRGELVALQKRDVDLEGARPTVTVRRSWDNDTTKSGRSRVIPIHPDLLPYLVDAMDRSPSALVFAREDDEMHSRDIKLPRLLRAALNRAGLTDGWVLKCRRCRHQEPSRSSDRKKCPSCDFTLWPSPRPRQVRFQDLRHTTVTLLMRAGASLAHAARLAGHSDIRLTAETYGHLDFEDLRRPLEALSFPRMAEVLEARRGAPVVRLPGRAKNEAPEAVDFSNNLGGLHQSGRQDLNLRPLGPEPSALPG